MLLEGHLHKHHHLQLGRPCSKVLGVGLEPASVQENAVLSVRKGAKFLWVLVTAHCN